MLNIEMKISLTRALLLVFLMACSSSTYASKQEDITDFAYRSGAWSAQLSERIGKVAVYTFEGDLSSYAGQDNISVRAYVASRFLENHDDIYDAVYVFSNFDVVLEDAAAFHMSTRNNVSGIGKNIWDNSADFGSDGVLDSYIEMGSLDYWDSSLSTSGSFNIYVVALHEFWHRWVAGVSVEGGDENVLRGKDNSHWSAKINNGGSVMYGNNWAVINDNQFKSSSTRSRLSRLDLYMAGLYSEEQVGDISYIVTDDIESDEVPRNNVTVTGTESVLQVQDIIARNGPRIPSVEHSQRNFNAAIILLTRPGVEPSPEKIYFLNQFANNYSEYFAQKTGGRAYLNFSLEANNPIKAVLDTNTLDEVDLELSLGWLQKQKKGDHWSDSTETEIRDTITVHETLQNYESNYFDSISSWSANQKGLEDIDNISYLVRAGNKDYNGLLNEFTTQNAGWSLYRGGNESVFDLAVVIENLPRVTSKSTLDLLLQHQNDDGGWGIREGSPSEPLITARVLSAFSSLFVKNQSIYKEIPDGTIESAYGYIGSLSSLPNDPLFYSNYLSSVYLSKQPQAYLADLAVETLEGSQLLNGSWDNSVYTTAKVLNSLNSKYLPNIAINCELDEESSSIIKGEILSIACLVTTDSIDFLNDVNLKVSDQEEFENVVIETLSSLSGWKYKFELDTAKYNQVERIYFEVNENGSVAESKKSDNIAFVDIVYENKPDELDLAIYDSEFEITPNNISSYAQVVSVNGVVRNLSSQYIEYAPVDIYQQVGGDVLEHLVRVVAYFDANGRAAFNYDVIVTNAYKIIAKIDLVDLKSVNNTATKDILRNLSVDFSLDNLSAQSTLPLVSKETSVISVQASNKGLSSSGTVPLHFTVLSNLGELIFEEVRNLVFAPGEVINSIFEFQVDLIGNYKILAVLDNTNLIPESNEDNNSKDLDVSVMNNQGINLRVQRSGLEGELELTQSAAAAFTLDISNNGSAASSPTRLVIYDSNAEGSPEIASAMIPVIDGNSSVNISIIIDSIDFFGSRKLDFVVDPDDLVNETSEEDNLVFINVESISLSDIYVSDVIHTEPTRPLAGEAFNIVYEVGNLGGQAVENVEVEINISGQPIHLELIEELLPGKKSIFVYSVESVNTDSPVEIDIVVDPSGLIDEVAEGNNSASLKVLFNDNPLYVSEPIFSPNGDGVKDFSIIQTRCLESCELKVIDSNGGELGIIATGSDQFEWAGDVDGYRLADGHYELSLSHSKEKIASEVITIDTNSISITDSIKNNNYLLRNLYGSDRDICWVGWSQEALKYVFDVCRHNYWAQPGEDDLFGHLAPGLYSISPFSDTPTLISERLHNRDYGRVAKVVGKYLYSDYGIYDIEYGTIIDEKVNGYSGGYSSEYFEFDGYVYHVDINYGEIGFGCELERSELGIMSFETIISYDFDYSINELDTVCAAYMGKLEEFDGRLYGNNGVIDLVDGTATLYQSDVILGSRSDNFLVKVKDTGVVTIRNYQTETIKELDFSDRQTLVNPLVYIDWSPDGNKFLLYLYDYKEPEWQEPRLLYQVSNEVEQFDAITNEADAGFFVVVDARDLTILKDVNLNVAATEDINSVNISVADEIIQYLPFQYNTEIIKLKNILKNSDEYGYPVWEVLEDAGVSNFDISHLSNTDDIKMKPTVLTGWGSSSSPIGGAFISNNQIIDFSYYSNSFYPELDSKERYNHVGMVHNLVDDNAYTLLPSIAVSSIFGFENGNLIVSRGYDKRSDISELKLYTAESLKLGNIPINIADIPFNVGLWGNRNSDYPGAPSSNFTGYITNLDNMIANLMLDRRGDVGVGVVITAYDSNLSTYELYYKKTSDEKWSILSEVNQIPSNNFLWGIWTPPTAGSYQVKVNLSDKAGNKQTVTNNIVWGESSDISNVRLDNSKISPNSDGEYDSAMFSYDVNRPTYVDFQVTNPDGKSVFSDVITNPNVIQKFSYTWGGRDQNGQVLADGVYSVSINGAQLFVIIDTQAPSVTDTSSNNNLFGLNAILSYRTEFVDTDISSISISATIDGERKEITSLNSLEYSRLPEILSLDIELLVVDDVGNKTVIPKLGSDLLNQFYLSIVGVNGNLQDQFYINESEDGRLFYVYYFNDREDQLLKVEALFSNDTKININFKKLSDSRDEEFSVPLSFVFDNGYAYIDLAEIEQILSEYSVTFYTMSVANIGVDGIRKVEKYNLISSSEADLEPGRWHEFYNKPYDFEKKPVPKYRYNYYPSVGLLNDVDDFSVNVRSTSDERYTSSVNILYLENASGLILLDQINYQTCGYYEFTLTAEGKDEYTYNYKSPCNGVSFFYGVGAMQSICNETSGHTKITVNFTSDGSENYIRYVLYPNAETEEHLPIYLTDYQSNISEFSVFEINNTELLSVDGYVLTAEIINKDGLETSRVASNILKPDTSMPRIAVNSPSMGESVCLSDGVKITGVIYDTSPDIHRSFKYNTPDLYENLHFNISGALGDLEEYNEDFKRNSLIKTKLEDGTYASILQGDLATIYDYHGNLKETVYAVDSGMNLACAAVDLYIDGLVEVEFDYQNGWNLEDWLEVDGYYDNGYKEYSSFFNNYNEYNVQLISPNGDGVYDEFVTHFKNDENVVIEAYIDDVLIYTTPIDGPFSIEKIVSVPGEVFTVSDGAYNLVLKVTDGCGNLVQSEEFPLVIDRTPPVASILSPTVSEQILLNTAFVVTAADKHIANIKLFATPVGTDIRQLLYEGEGYLVSELLDVINTRNYSGGVTFTLEVVDLGGSMSSDSITLNVDTPSTLVLDYSLNNRFFSPNGDGRADQLSGIVSFSDTMNYSISYGDQVLYSLESASSISAFEIPQQNLVDMPDGELEFTLDVVRSSDELVSESHVFKAIKDVYGPVIQPSFLSNDWEISITDLHLMSASCEISFDRNFYENFEFNQAQASGGQISIIKRTNTMKDGDYTITCIAEDLAGNQSEFITSQTLDRTPPELNVLPEEEMFLLDQAVSVLNLEIESSDLNDYSVLVSLDNVVLSNDAAVEQLSKEYNVSGYSDGSHELLVFAEDDSGNVTFISKNIELDSAPPVITITPPEYVKPGDIIDFDVLDPNLESIKVMVDGNLENHGADPLQFIWNEGFIEGNHELVIEAEDKLNHLTEITFNVTQDTIAPNPVTSLSAEYNSEMNLVISWVGTVSKDLDFYEVYVGGVNIGSTKNELFSFDSGEPDTVEVYIVAVDNAGNRSSDNPITEVVYDITAPLIDILSPTEGAHYPDSIRVKALIWDDHEVSTVVEIVGSGGEIIYSNVITGRTISFQFDSALLNGDFNLTLESSDEFGNESQKELSFVLDNNPPDAPTGLTISDLGDLSYRLSWIAPATDEVITYEIWMNGEVFRSGIAELSVDFTIEKDGIFNFTVVAVDSLGNRSQPSLSEVLTIENRLPEFSLVMPVFDEIFDQSFNVELTFEDEDIQSFSSRLISDSSVLDLPNMNVYDSGVMSWVVDSTELAYGKYSLAINATDASGNTFENLVPVERADLTPPAKVSELNAQQQNNQLILSWVKSESTDVARYLVAVFSKDSGQEIYTLTDVAPEITEVSLTIELMSLLPSSEVEIKIIAVDEAGNESDMTSITKSILNLAVLLQPYSPIYKDITYNLIGVNLSGEIEVVDQQGGLLFNSTYAESSLQISDYFADGSQLRLQKEVDTSVELPVLFEENSIQHSPGAAYSYVDVEEYLTFDKTDFVDGSEWFYLINEHIPLGNSLPFVSGSEMRYERRFSDYYESDLLLDLSTLSSGELVGEGVVGAIRLEAWDYLGNSIPFNSESPVSDVLIVDESYIRKVPFTFYPDTQTLEFDFPVRASQLGVKFSVDLSSRISQVTWTTMQAQLIPLDQDVLVSKFNDQRFGEFAQDVEIRVGVRGSDGSVSISDDVFTLEAHQSSLLPSISLTAEISNDKIYLNWDNVEDVFDQFIVYQNQSSVAIVDVLASEPTSLLIEAKGGLNRLSVVGLSSDALSQESNSVDVYFDMDVPSAISDFNAFYDVDSHHVDLDWALTENADSYEIYRWHFLNNSFVLIGTAELNEFQDTELQYQSYYEYYVKAVNGEGESSPASEIRSIFTADGIDGFGLNIVYPYDGRLTSDVTQTVIIDAKGRDYFNLNINGDEPIVIANDPSKETEFTRYSNVLNVDYGTFSSYITSEVGNEGIYHIADGSLILSLSGSIELLDLNRTLSANMIEEYKYFSGKLVLITGADVISIDTQSNQSNIVSPNFFVTDYSVIGGEFLLIASLDGGLYYSNISGGTLYQIEGTEGIFINRLSSDVSGTNGAGYDGNLIYPISLDPDTGLPSLGSSTSVEGIFFELGYDTHWLSDHELAFMSNEGFFSIDLLDGKKSNLVNTDILNDWSIVGSVFGKLLAANDYEEAVGTMVFTSEGILEIEDIFDLTILFESDELFEGYPVFSQGGQFCLGIEGFNQSLELSCRTYPGFASVDVKLQPGDNQISIARSEMPQVVDDSVLVRKVGDIASGSVIVDVTSRILGSESVLDVQVLNNSEGLLDLTKLELSITDADLNTERFILASDEVISEGGIYRTYMSWSPTNAGRYYASATAKGNTWSETSSLAEFTVYASGEPVIGVDHRGDLLTATLDTVQFIGAAELIAEIQFGSVIYSQRLASRNFGRYSQYEYGISAPDGYSFRTGFTVRLKLINDEGVVLSDYTHTYDGDWVMPTSVTGDFQLSSVLIDPGSPINILPNYIISTGTWFNGSVIVNLSDSEGHQIQSYSQTASYWLNGDTFTDNIVFDSTELSDGTYVIRFLFQGADGIVLLNQSQVVSIENTVPEIQASLDVPETLEFGSVLEGEVRLMIDINNIEDAYELLLLVDNKQLPIATKSLSEMASIYTISVASDLFHEGINPITIAIKNVESGLIANLVSSDVLYTDLSAPEILADELVGQVYVTPSFRFNFDVNDQHDGIKLVEVSVNGISEEVISNGSRYAYQLSEVDSGSTTLSIYAEDNYGNNAILSHNLIVDGTAPIVTFSGAEEGAYYSAPVTIIVSAEDDWLARLDIAVNNQSITDTYFTSLEDAEYDVRATAIDLAGNITRKTLGYVIDTIAPSISSIGFPEDGLTNQDVSYSLICMDTNPSAFEVVMTLDGSIVMVESEGTLADEGIYSVSVNCQDLAGNTSSHKIDFEIDKAAPETPILVEKVGSGSGEDRVLISQQEAGTTLYLEFEGEVLTYFAVTDQFEVPITLHEGMNSFIFWAVDEAGNRSDDGTLELEAILAPEVSIVTDISALPNVLVWVPWFIDCTEAQANQLRTLLDASGIDFHIVSTTSGFERAMRSQEFDTVILAERSDLFGLNGMVGSLTAVGLRLQVASGAKIISIDRPATFYDFGKEVFGIDRVYTDSKVLGVFYPTADGSVISSEAHGLATRIRKDSDVVAVGTVELKCLIPLSCAFYPTEEPSVMLFHAYGDGDAVTSTFDLFDLDTSEFGGELLSEVINSLGSLPVESFSTRRITFEVNNNSSEELYYSLSYSPQEIELLGTSGLLLPEVKYPIVGTVVNVNAYSLSLDDSAVSVYIYYNGGIVAEQSLTMFSELQSYQSHVEDIQSLVNDIDYGFFDYLTYQLIVEKISWLQSSAPSTQLEIDLSIVLLKDVFYIVNTWFPETSEALALEVGQLLNYLYSLEVYQHDDVDCPDSQHCDYHHEEHHHGAGHHYH